MSGPNRIELLIIDPQRDFIEPSGALSVPNAEADMLNLATFLSCISRSPRLGDVHVTLDSHHQLHIAHPFFWVDKDMNPPAPFTIITVDDVQSHRWRARFSILQSRAVAYVESLARSGRYPLCI